MAPGDPFAAEIPVSADFTGRMVALRTLTAARGALPPENLETLLQVQQDAPLNPAAVRQDVRTLYRVGAFSQVEVDVEPWPYQGPDGELREGLHVDYRLSVTPRLIGVDVVGDRVLTAAQLREATGLDTGQSWRLDDPDPAARAVRDALIARGWPDATVSARLTTSGDNGVRLRLDIHAGAPHLLSQISVPRQDALSARRVRAVLARAGLREGKRVTTGALAAGRDALMAALRDDGWYEATVAFKEVENAQGHRLLVLVDPRRQWHVAIDGREDNWLSNAFSSLSGARLPSRRAVAETLGLADGVRSSRYFAEDASRALQDHERSRGWLDAEIRVELVENPDDVTLTVHGRRGRRHRLGELRVDGDSVYDARFLRGALREASPPEVQPGWAIFGWGRQRATPEGVDAALDDIAGYYRSQGYPDVEIARSGFVPRAKGDPVPVDVTLKVTSGPRVTVRQLLVDGGMSEVAAADLFADLRGQPWNPTAVQERTRRLVARYREEGYLGADASIEATRAAGSPQVDIGVHVQPGPLVYLRGAIVRGHRRTRRAVIDREIDVRAGEPIRPSALARIRRDLYDLGVFSRVSVDPVGDEDRVKDLVVTVEENKNLFFEVGGGLATDEGIKLTARGGHRNLFGLAHRFTAYGQAGLGWVGDGWSLDLVPEWQVGMRYEAPHIPGRGERVALDVLLSAQAQEPNYRMERSGGEPSVRLKLGSRATAEIGYQVQARTLLDVDPGLLVDGDPWLDELQVSELSDPRPVLPSAARIHSGLDASFVFDTRDDNFNPTRGGIGNVSALVTDGVISDLLFLRGQATLTWFVPIGGLQVVLRGSGGAAWVPGQDGALPIEDRFTLGGATFRGHAPNAVGPANEVSAEYVTFPDGIAPVVEWSDRDAPSRWVPTGGDAMAAGTTELQIPLDKLGLKGWGAWKVALFCDFGNVFWVSPLVKTDSMLAGTDPVLRYGVGFGIRRSTPIGPIAIDLGFNPSRLQYREEDLVRVHVALGAQ